MSDDAAQSPALRPWTIPAGVAAGFAVAALLVLRSVLELVHRPTIVDANERHVFTIGITAGVSVGAAVTVAASIVIAVAAVRSLHGSHGWRVALAALAGWQAAESLFGVLVSAVVSNLPQPSTMFHITRPSPALLIAVALVGGLCVLLLVLPTTNRWYRAQRPARASAASAGWYPVEDGVLRWWNGAAWTGHTHRIGTAGDQPIPGADG